MHDNETLRNIRALESFLGTSALCCDTHSGRLPRRPVSSTFNNRQTPQPKGSVIGVLRYNLETRELIMETSKYGV